MQEPTAKPGAQRTRTPLLLAAGLLLVLAALVPQSKPFFLLAALAPVPILLLGTYFAGGYDVIDTLPGKRNPAAPTFILLIGAACVFGTAPAYLLVPIATLLVAGRAFQMLGWSIRGFADKPGLIGVNRFRLGIGAVLMMVAFWLAASWMITWTVDSPDEIGDADTLVKLVALEMAHAKVAKQIPGEPPFISIDDASSIWNWLTYGEYRVSKKPDNFSVNVASDRSRFTILLKPSGDFLFPWNLIIFRPTFRADSSAAIRMKLVHFKGEECPANAAVVYTVPDSYINQMIMYSKDRAKSDPADDNNFKWASKSSLQEEEVYSPPQEDTAAPNLKVERRRRWCMGDARW